MYRLYANKSTLILKYVSFVLSNIRHLLITNHCMLYVISWFDQLVEFSISYVNLYIYIFLFTGVLVNLHHPPEVYHDTDDIRSELAELLSSTFPSLRARRRPPAPPLSLFSSGPRKQSLRRPKSGSPDDGNTDKVVSHECGPINIEAVQQIMAAKWAVDVINNQSKPNDLKIGTIRNTNTRFMLIPSLHNH